MAKELERYYLPSGDSGSLQQQTAVDGTQGLPSYSLPSSDTSTGTTGTTGTISGTFTFDQIGQIRDIVTKQFESKATDIARWGAGNQVFKITDAGIHLGNGDFSSAPFRVAMDGSLVASSATITGSITATSGAIGGFSIGTDYIRDAANSFGLASTVTGGDDVRFWAGAAFASRSSAPFRITEAGVLTATSGTLGGWTLSATTLTATNLVLDSSGQKITLGSGTDVAILDAADATYRLVIGHSTYSSAPFRVTKAGAVSATSGTIGGWTLASTTLSATGITLDAGNQKITVGSGSPSISIDGANTRIRSSNYSSGVAGFTVEPTLIEAENLVARGTMRGVTFKYDVVSSVGGQLMVTNSDALASDMTALDSATMTIRGDTTFAANDILLIRAVTGAGIQEEWFRVTSAASAPTYSVTRDLAAAYAANNNPTWQAGTSVVKQGVSDGGASYSGGWLRLFGQGTNSPFYSVFARTGVAYNAYSEVARFGNLNGIGSFVSDTYGFYVGDSSTGNYISYDTSSGTLVVNDSIISNQDIFGDGSDGNATISGDTTLSSDVFYNNLTVNNGITLNTGGYRIFVKGTLTNSGTISRNGSAGSNGGNASGKTAGSAGTGGAALADGSIPGAQAGKNGAAGVAGVDSPGASGMAGNKGNNGSNGTNQAKAVVGDGVNGTNGGDGGYSRAIDGTTSGGTGGTKGSATGTVYNKIRTSAAAYNLFDIYSGATVQPLATAAQGGGAATGGSGGAFDNGSGGATATSGGTGGGGGGGGNAGFVTIFARKIVNTGTISANGGVGGNAGTTAASTTGGGGQSAAGGSGGSAGGHGGAGGALILIYNILNNSGTISASAGAGGTKGTAQVGVGHNMAAGSDGSDGQNGNTGTTGVIIQLRV